MGIISLLKKGHEHGQDLNDMAIAMGNVIVLLDRYEQTKDVSVLPIAGWLCAKGINDVIEKGNMHPHYSIFVVINGVLEKMTIRDAYSDSVVRYTTIVEQLCEQDKAYLLGIINKGLEFGEFDGMLSNEQKNKVLKTNISFS